ncbi:MAG: molybdopterin dinucleotide binding domain-containing protein, partial [bacterium]
YANKKTGGRAVIWARPYEPAPEIPDNEFPFWLTTGRVLEHWHTGSMTRRIPHLHRAVPEAYVEMHPADAAELGIQKGEKVRVRSRRGAVELKVIWDGKGKPRRGSVFVPFFDESKLINEVTLDSYCPISKEPDYKKCAVTIEKMRPT